MASTITQREWRIIISTLEDAKLLVDLQELESAPSPPTFFFCLSIVDILGPPPRHTLGELRGSKNCTERVMRKERMPTLLSLEAFPMSQRLGRRRRSRRDRRATGVARREQQNRLDEEITEENPSFLGFLKTGRAGIRSSRTEGGKRDADDYGGFCPRARARVRPCSWWRAYGRLNILQTEARFLEAHYTDGPSNYFCHP